MLTLSHKTLDVYKISLSLIRGIYKAAGFFPKEEQYILTSQIRRAAISVEVILRKVHQEYQDRRKNIFMKLHEVHW